MPSSFSYAFDELLQLADPCNYYFAPLAAPTIISPNLVYQMPLSAASTIRIAVATTDKTTAYTIKNTLAVLLNLHCDITIIQKTLWIRIMRGASDVWVCGYNFRFQTIRTLSKRINGHPSRTAYQFFDWGLCFCILFRTFSHANNHFSKLGLPDSTK